MTLTDTIKPQAGPATPPAPPAALATPHKHEVTRMGFDTMEGFEALQRAAKLLSSSSLVPAAFRSSITKGYGDKAREEVNPNGLPNCVVALNMANRMGIDALMVMQNLYIVEGKPGWSSQFIIAAVNQCGRFSPLRFDLSEEGPEEEVTFHYSEWNDSLKKKEQKTGKVKFKNRTCRAWATELATGLRLESAEVSIKMAALEGWLQKNGSKWQTMPEVMLRYRAASFFGKTYAPELLMGYQSKEEVEDTIIDITPEVTVVNGGAPQAPPPTTIEGLKAKVSAEQQPAAAPEPKAPEAAAPAEPAVPAADPAAEPPTPAPAAAPAPAEPAADKAPQQPMGQTHRDSLFKHAKDFGVPDEVAKAAAEAMDKADKAARRKFFADMTAGDKGVFDPYYPQVPPAGEGLPFDETTK